MTAKGTSKIVRRGGFDFVQRLDSGAPWVRGLTLALFLALVLCILMPELVFQNKIFLVPDSTAWESFASVGRATLEKGRFMRATVG